MDVENVRVQFSPLLLIATKPRLPVGILVLTQIEVHEMHTTAKRNTVRAFGNPVRDALRTNRIAEPDHARNRRPTMLTVPSVATRRARARSVT